MSSASPLALDRDGRLFWAARVVAAVGGGVSALALPLLVLAESGSASLTASVTALQVAPYLVLGLPAGALADRLPRRAVMLAAQAVSAAALLSVPIVDRAGALHVAHLLAVAAVVACAFVFFDAAAFGALPAVVGRDAVVTANGAIWTASTLAAVVGPALGGVLVATLGASGALAVDAGAYVLAGVLLLAVTTPFGPTGAAPDRVRTTDLIREGLAFIRQQPLVRTLTTVGVHNSVAGGAVTAMLVVLGTMSGPGSATSGAAALVTAAAVGAFVAALALPRLHGRVATGSLTLGGLGAAFLAVAALATSPWGAGTVAAVVAWSAAHTLVILNGIAARQLLTPDGLQARVNTTARMVAWGGAPVGALLAGLVAEVADPRAAIALAALVLALGVRHGRRAGLADA